MKGARPAAGLPCSASGKGRSLGEEEVSGWQCVEEVTSQLRAFSYLWNRRPAAAGNAIHGGQAGEGVFFFIKEIGWSIGSARGFAKQVFF